MSIEMENPQTTLEKADAAANYVAQIRLAFMIGDRAKVEEGIENAQRLLCMVVEELDEAQ